MLKQTIILGTYSLLLVLTYTSYSAIITKIHEQQGHQNLGPILLACSFASFMIMNSFSPSLPYNFKTLFIVAGFCYILSYVTVIPNLGVTYMYIAAIVGVIFGGIGASVFWVSQGAYMDTLCNQSRTNTRGKYFGILNVFIFANLILASVVTTFSLGLFSNQIYYGILTGIGVLGLIFGVIFIKDIQTSEVALQKIQTRKSLSLKQMVINSCLYYPKMKAIIPLCILDGVGLGLTLTSILHLIPQSGNKQTDDANAGILNIILGVGAVIGAYSSGYLTDKISVKLVGYASVIFLIITAWMTIAASKINQVWSAYLCGFFWGLTLYYLESFMLVLCSKVYGGAAQAFAVNKQVHSFSFVLYQIALIVTDDSLDVKIVCVFLILFSFPAFYFLRNLPPARQEVDSSNKQQIPMIPI